MLKKYLKNRVIIMGLLLAVFGIFSILISYSYYVGTVLNNEQNATVSLKSSGVTIIYENNSGYLTSDNFDPGTVITKQFSIVSNATESDMNSNSKIWYNIKLIIEENTFTDNKINHSLSVDSTSSALGKTASEFSNIGIPTGQNLNGITIGCGYIVPGQNKHVYNLSLEHTTGDEFEADRSIVARVVVELVNIITLNIDLDGGQFPSGNAIERQYGENSIVILETPTKENHEFIGWELVTGTGVSITDNILTIGTTNVSIKANWNPLIPPAGTFATDDWATIAYYASNPVNDRAPYEVGETREISLSGFTNGEANSGGKYTIRVANNSNYDCTLDSKTACGFVVEFKDIINNQGMNATNTNAGGWPVTELRGYVNTNIFNALPSDLRAVIIDTPVVSGHGSSDKNTARTDGNWTSTDKLYLLSTREIWGNCTGGTSNGAGCWDSASLDTITRQLDYYANLGVVTSSSTKYKEAIKQLDGTDSGWWLRLARSDSRSGFSSVNTRGNSSYIASITTVYGVAPAFRIELAQ